MEKKKVNLTVDDIVNIEFKKSKIFGYKKDEVDEYLNKIIEDYENFNEIIAAIHLKNKEYREKNKTLNNKINELLNNNDLDENIEKNLEEPLSMTQRIAKLEQDFFDLKESINSKN